MRRRETTLLIATFLLPAGGLYALLVLYPMARAFYIALFAWRGVSVHKEWVGLENFAEIFRDEVFWMSLKHNFFILGVSSVVILGLGLFLAVALSRRRRDAHFFRLVYLFPNVMSVVAISVLWSFLYHPQMGLINGLLRLLGREGRTWLGDPATALPAVTVTYLWSVLGFYIVLFLAGILSIPRDLYDAAKIDGAGEVATFRHVTFPLLWEPLKLAVIFLLINALNVFSLVFIMTNGGQPSRHTEVILTYLYEQAFDNSNFGYATAIGAVLFVLIFGLSQVLLRLMRRETVEF